MFPKEKPGNMQLTFPKKMRNNDQIFKRQTGKTL